MLTKVCRNREDRAQPCGVERLPVLGERREYRGVRDAWGMGVGEGRYARKWACEGKSTFESRALGPRSFLEQKEFLEDMVHGNDTKV